jgi:hypothetical protein
MTSYTATMIYSQHIKLLILLHCTLKYIKQSEWYGKCKIFKKGY